MLGTLPCFLTDLLLISLPLTYLQLESAVESEKKRVPPVMSWDDFLKLGVQCSILREEGTMRWWLADLPMLTRLAAELVRATALLHDMGSLLCFRGKKLDLSQFVILDPQWLTKMMAQGKHVHTTQDPD